MKTRSATGGRKEEDEDISNLKRKKKFPKPNLRILRSEYEKHFKHQLEGLTVVTTTRTPQGQILDWVEVKSQLSKGRLATPPPEPKPQPAARGKFKHELTQFELSDPAVSRGPEGTVPILRKDLSKLPFNKSLQDFLSKSGQKTYSLRINDRDELEMPVDGGHDYAYTSQWLTCFGGDGNLSAYDPYVQWSDEFSLLQIALARGSGSNKQTLEAGWQEYPDLYGDWVPHLFVFYTTNGYTMSGDDLGGYNRDVTGWVQFSSRIFPGAISSPNSMRGGAQFIMQIKYRLFRGNWWLRCNGEWVGYYPASLFNTTGLRNQAEKVAFYGEVADSGGHVGQSHTDMGSGYWPEYRWQYSAYLSNLRYQSNAAGRMTDYNGSDWASDPALYDLELHMNSGTNWGSYYWLGGPGAIEGVNCQKLRDQIAEADGEIGQLKEDLRSEGNPSKKAGIAAQIRKWRAIRSALVEAARNSNCIL